MIKLMPMIFLFFLFVIIIQGSEEQNDDTGNITEMNGEVVDTIIIQKTLQEITDENLQKTFKRVAIQDKHDIDMIRYTIRKANFKESDAREKFTSPVADLIALQSILYDVTYDISNCDKYITMTTKIDSPKLLPQLKFAKHSWKLHCCDELPETEDFLFIIPDVFTNKIDTLWILNRLIGTCLKHDSHKNNFHFAYPPNLPTERRLHHVIQTLHIQLFAAFSDSFSTIDFSKLNSVHHLHLRIGASVQDRSFVLNKMIIKFPILVENVVIKNNSVSELNINYNPNLENSISLFPNFHAITKKLEIQGANIMNLNFQLFSGTEIKFANCNLFSDDIEWPRAYSSRPMNIVFQECQFRQRFSFAGMEYIEELTFDACVFANDQVSFADFPPFSRLPRTVKKLTLRGNLGMLKWFIQLSKLDSITEIELKYYHLHLDTAQDLCALFSNRYLETSTTTDCENYLRARFQEENDVGYKKTSIYPDQLKAAIKIYNAKDKILEIKNEYVTNLDLQVFVGPEIKFVECTFFSDDIIWPRTNSLRTINIVFQACTFRQNFNLGTIELAAQLTFDGCSFKNDEVPFDNLELILPVTVQKLSFRSDFGMIKWFNQLTKSHNVLELEFHWGYPAPQMQLTARYLCALFGDRYLENSIESELWKCEDYLATKFEEVQKQGNYKMSIYPPELEAEINACKPKQAISQSKYNNQ